MSFATAQEMGRPIEILDESSPITTDVESLNFVGGGVSASGSPDVTVTVGGFAGTRIEETPTGTINGVNATFTLSQTPVSNTLQVFLNGAFQTAGGVDYTRSGVTLTFVNAPDTGSGIRAIYEY